MSYGKPAISQFDSHNWYPNPVKGYTLDRKLYHRDHRPMRDPGYNGAVFPKKPTKRDLRAYGPLMVAQPGGLHRNNLYTGFFAHAGNNVTDFGLDKKGLISDVLHLRERAPHQATADKDKWWGPFHVERFGRFSGMHS